MMTKLEDDQSEEFVDADGRRCTYQNPVKVICVMVNICRIEQKGFFLRQARMIYEHKVLDAGFTSSKGSSHVTMQFLKCSSGCAEKG